MQDLILNEPRYKQQEVHLLKLSYITDPFDYRIILGWKRLPVLSITILL